MVFRLFWILTRKTCVFAGKFLAGLSKILSTCPVEHLQIKFSEWKSWKLEDFRKIFEVFGTMAEKFSRVGKTAIDVRGYSLWKFFSKEKTSLFFPIVSECLLPSKVFARAAETAIYVSVEVFGEKQFLKYIYSFTLFSDSDPKNV